MRPDRIVPEAASQTPNRRHAGDFKPRRWFTQGLRRGPPQRALPGGAGLCLSFTDGSSSAAAHKPFEHSPMLVYPPQIQRPALLDLVEALRYRLACLRRDRCGNWRINGRYGRIYAVSGMPGRPGVEGFLLCYSGPEFLGSARGGGFARRAFEAFGCEVTQDGDDEGIMFLDRLPTAGKAEVIRDKLRIPKKRPMGEAELERLRALSAKRFRSTRTHRCRRDQRRGTAFGGSGRAGIAKRPGAGFPATYELRPGPRARLGEYYWPPFVRNGADRQCPAMRSLWPTCGAR